MFGPAPGPPERGAGLEAASVRHAVVRRPGAGGGGRRPGRGAVVVQVRGHRRTRRRADRKPGGPGKRWQVHHRLPRRPGPVPAARAAAARGEPRAPGPRHPLRPALLSRQPRPLPTGSGGDVRRRGRGHAAPESGRARPGRRDPRGGAVPGGRSRRPPLGGLRAGGLGRVHRRHVRRLRTDLAGRRGRAVAAGLAPRPLLPAGRSPTGADRPHVHEPQLGTVPPLPGDAGQDLRADARSPGRGPDHRRGRHGGRRDLPDPAAAAGAVQDRSPHLAPPARHRLAGASPRPRRGGAGPRHRRLRPGRRRHQRGTAGRRGGLHRRRHVRARPARRAVRPRRVRRRRAPGRRGHRPAGGRPRDAGGRRAPSGRRDVLGGERALRRPGRPRLRGPRRPGRQGARGGGPVRLRQEHPGRAARAAAGA